MTKLERAIDDITNHVADPKYVSKAADLLVREYGVRKDYPVKLVLQAFSAVTA